MFINRLFVVAASVCLCGAAPLVAAAASPADGAPSSSSSASASTPDAHLDALPEAPEPQASSPSAAASSNSSGGHQTKRILGIVPNFRAVSADQKLPPQTVHEKFKTAFQDSFDYSSFIFAAGQAGVAQAQDSYPAFRQGGVGYGRYLWHTFADQTDENTLVEGILPTVLHQDSRYYTLGHGGILKRAVYSFSRTVITRTDGGNETVNASELVGAGAASGISAAYYPGQYRTWTKVGQRWLTSVIIDGATFTVKEFWPDINDAVFHQKD